MYQTICPEEWHFVKKKHPSCAEIFSRKGKNSITD